MSRGVARVLIVAGEASGDLYAGLLMRAMGAAGSAAPDFAGIGGPAMRSAGLRPLADASALGVTGFLEVFGSLRAIWMAYRGACSALDDPVGRPDLVILVDYPDFNLRLARRARRAGVPVLYFISPQVWAWRAGRLRQITAAVDRMLVILPFEEEIYRKTSVPVEFVGHPLLDLVRATRTRAQTLAPLGLDPGRATVALLPGSRRNEIRNHLKPMLGAAGLLLEEFRDLQFLVPIAPTLSPEEIADAAHAAGGPQPILVTEDRYDAIAAVDAAVVASGTATLEVALLGIPMVIVYRMNPLTYVLARAVSAVPHIGMANLIAGERVVPELVQGACRPESIAREVRRILTEPDAAAAMRRGLAGVREKLGRHGAIERVARVAWDMIAARRAGRGAGQPVLGGGGRGAATSGGRT